MSKERIMQFCYKALYINIIRINKNGIGSRIKQAQTDETLWLPALGNRSMQDLINFYSIVSLTISIILH